MTDTPPFTKPEQALGVITDAGADHAGAAMRLEKRLRETTHFFHSVEEDHQGQRRWHVQAGLAGLYSSTMTEPHAYGGPGADALIPVSEGVRKQAEDEVFALVRADFFTVLGLEEFIP